MITRRELDGLKREARELRKRDPALTAAMARHKIARSEGFENWGALARSVQVPVRMPEART